MTYIIIAIISAYLIGSIPSAVWVGKMYFNIDVRKHGSKNAGATNTFRVLGKKPGIIVLVMDIVKGWFAVFIWAYFAPYESGTDALINLKLGLSVAAILGHVFPIFAQFNGGKGVATSLGVLLAIHLPTAAVCLSIFLLIFILSKYVSLGAIFAAIAFPCVAIFIFKITTLSFVVFSILMAIVVLFTHRKNIERLLNREENKMKFNNK